MFYELNVKSQSNTTVLEIHTGKNRGCELIYKKLAGHAYLSVGSDIYEMKLMMFPKQTYYLKQNKDSKDRYTGYSKRVLENGSTRFLNPVAYGRLSEHIPSHLEVYFPLLGRFVFIDLFPVN